MVKGWSILDISSDSVLIGLNLTNQSDAKLAIFQDLSLEVVRLWYDI